MSLLSKESIYLQIFLLGFLLHSRIYFLENLNILEITDLFLNIHGIIIIGLCSLLGIGYSIFVKKKKNEIFNDENGREFFFSFMNSIHIFSLITFSLGILNFQFERIYLLYITLILLFVCSVEKNKMYFIFGLFSSVLYLILKTNLISFNIEYLQFGFLTISLLLIFLFDEIQSNLEKPIIKMQNIFNTFLIYYFGILIFIIGNRYFRTEIEIQQKIVSGIYLLYFNIFVIRFLKHKSN